MDIEIIEIIETILTSPYLGLAAICFSIAGFIFQLILTEGYKKNIVRENNRLLEELRWEFKVREQAAKVAEYMDLARHLGKDSPDDVYHKANVLAWELAMWLPTEIYRKLGKSLTDKGVEISPLDVVVEVRKILLKDKSGNLCADDIIHHARGIGERKQRADNQ
jgi:hypothetical protein